MQWNDFVYTLYLWYIWKIILKKRKYVIKWIVNMIKYFIVVLIEKVELLNIDDKHEMEWNEHIQSKFSCDIWYTFVCEWNGMLTRKQEWFCCAYLTDLAVRYLAFGRGLFALWTCKLCVLLLGRVPIRSRRAMLKKIKLNEILPAKISLLFWS